jgi:hypothetical protein
VGEHIVLGLVHQKGELAEALAQAIGNGAPLLMGGRAELGRYRVADRDLLTQRSEPHAWLSETLTKLVNPWPASRIDDLMPWAYAKIAPAVA